MQETTKPQVRWEWISEGWHMFAAQWQTWVLHALIYFAIIIIPVLIVYVVFIASMIATQPQSDPGQPPVALFLILPILYLIIAVVSAYLLGGTYNTALKQLRGEKITVGDLFSGGQFFTRTLGAVIILGILGMIGLMLCIVPGLIVFGLFFFTMPLIIDRNLGALDAMKASYELTKQNLLMFSLFAFVTYFLASAGGYLCYVGALVTWPLLFTISAVAYRDMFGVKGAQKFTSSAVSSASSYAGQSWPQPPQPSSPQQSSLPPQPLSARQPFEAEPSGGEKAGRCPQCGASIARAAKFCNYCGHRLES